MAVQPLTLNVPELIYARLQQRARQTNRSVEDELLDVLTAAVSADDELPADLADAVSSLDALDDEALWEAARGGLPAEAFERLEELHLKRQRDGVTAAEGEELAGLVRQYERGMLVRAQAAALLRRRGHDVSGLAGR
jgi:plasmid stability protein